MTSMYVDIGLILALLTFGVLAFLKGFIKDFFSTLNLVLAAVLSYFLTPIIIKFFFKSGSQVVIELGIRFVVFIIILILCSMASSRISKPLVKNTPDSVNQSLGFAFGLAKGYFIIAFMFAVTIYFYSYSTDAKNRGMTRTELVKKDKMGPSWMLQSKSYSILSWGADMLQPFLDGIAEQTQGKLTKGIDIKKPEINGDQIIKLKKMYDDISPEDVSKKIDDVKKTNNDVAPDDANSGYTKQEIEKMKRLIEIMSN